MTGTDPYEEAELTAIAGLRFLGADEQLLSRFIALSGIDPAQLREAASSPAFLAGVLDFFIAHEPTLLQFAEAVEIDPQAIVAARDLLAGERSGEAQWP